MARSEGPSRLDIAIAPRPGSVAQARVAARGFIQLAGREDLTEAATVVVSELVANAVRYAPGPIRLKLRWRARVLHIEVHDTSPDHPFPRDMASASATNGRGLVIVDALARDWGSHVIPQGKVTWADVG